MKNIPSRRRQKYGPQEETKGKARIIGPQCPIYPLDSQNLTEKYRKIGNIPIRQLEQTCTNKYKQWFQSKLQQTIPRSVRDMPTTSTNTYKQVQTGAYAKTLEVQIHLNQFTRCSRSGDIPDILLQTLYTQKNKRMKSSQRPRTPKILKHSLKHQA